MRIHRSLIVGLLLCAWFSPGQVSGQEAVPTPPRSAAGSRLWVVSTRDGREVEGGLAPAEFRVWSGASRGLGRECRIQDLVSGLAPQAPLVVMVHGSFVEWKSVVRDAFPTFCWLQGSSPMTPLNVVVFSWPSDNTPQMNLAADVNFLGRRAGLQGVYLADLLSRIPPEHPVCLIGHSHGGRVVAAALHVLGGGQVEGWRFAGGQFQGHRIRAVLAAAAIDRHWLNPGELYDRTPGRVEKLINLVNQEDLPLVIYPLRSPALSQAVALTGFRPEDHRAIGPAASRLFDIDVTDLIQTRHTWANYYRQPEIAALIRPHVFFDGTDDPEAVRQSLQKIPPGTIRESSAETDGNSRPK